jgi:lipid-A-disaccharide synthase
LAPVDWFGVGGDLMAAAPQVELIIHARELSVLGVFEIIRHLPRLYGIERHLRAEIARRRPSFAVLVDLPGTNLRLSAYLHRLGIPVVYFVAPQLWAWRPGRVRFLRRYVRKLLCIFPFEGEFFRQRGVEVEYVGHPLVGQVQPSLAREEFFAHHRLDPGRRTVCLLPGSRNQEVARHLPLLLEAAERLSRRHALQCVLVQAGTVDPRLLQASLDQHPKLPVTRVVGSVYNALAWCDLAVISSGTATVEATLLQTPMVVVYRVALPTWWVGKLLVRTPHYSMVNLIAGKKLVPELIQHDFTAERLAAEMERLLSDPAARQRIQEELGEVKQRLGPPGAIDRAARALMAAVGIRPENQPAEQ